MKVPVTTGTGQRIELDTDDYVRLVTLPDACSGISPELWNMFVDDGQTLLTSVTSQVNPLTTSANASALGRST